MEQLRELPQIKSLNDEERRIFYSLLSSSRVGDDLDLSKLDQLYYSDYEEIPVSIDVFIKDDRYLGKVFNNGQSIYPFWRKTFHDFFHNNPDNAFELLITGAIGTGKSTSASIIMTYLIYRTMCLKNPQKFYNLTGNAPIVFVCMNLTLDLAYNGLYAMIVESIKMSPWFCERVDIRGKYNFSIEFPKNISLICGSTIQHTIGKNVLGACLTGDTKVRTKDGVFRIEELEGKYNIFYSLDNAGNVVESVPSITRKTKEITELYILELEDGTEIKCTADHRFLLKSGVYKRADELSAEDELEEVGDIT